MDLFGDLPPPTDGAQTQIAPGAVLLHGFAREADADLLQATRSVMAQAPLRHWQNVGNLLNVLVAQFARAAVDQVPLHGSLKCRKSACGEYPVYSPHNLR